MEREGAGRSGFIGSLGIIYYGMILKIDNIRGIKRNGDLKINVNLCMSIS